MEGDTVCRDFFMADETREGYERHELGPFFWIIFTELTRANKHFQTMCVSARSGELRAMHGNQELRLQMP